MSPDGTPEFLDSKEEQSINNNFSFVRHSSLRKILSGSLKVAGKLLDISLLIRIVQSIVADPADMPGVPTQPLQPAPQVTTDRFSNLRESTDDEGFSVVPRKDEDEFVLVESANVDYHPKIDVVGVKYMPGQDIVRSMVFVLRDLTVCSGCSACNVPCWIVVLVYGGFLQLHFWKIDRIHWHTK